MEWSERYQQDNPPTPEDIRRFIGSGLWEDLNAYLQRAYGVSPKTAYSKCAAQMGWNVKYQKSGRSLCTLYPMNGYFIALVVVGERETPRVEGVLPTFSNYVQALYGRTPFSAGGRWLMIEVKSQDVLEDVKRLIKIRVSPKEEKDMDKGRACRGCGTADKTVEMPGKTGLRKRGMV